MEFEGIANLLDIQMKGINYCADGLIADLYTSANLYISLGNATAGRKRI
jgi:hypothetical protein